MKLSIKKGHIVLGALVLALGAAVYLNWDYMKQTDYVAAGNTNQTTNENGVSKLADTGQTQLVQWFLLPAKIKELFSGRL